MMIYHMNISSFLINFIDRQSNKIINLFDLVLLMLA